MLNQTTKAMAAKAARACTVAIVVFWARRPATSPPGGDSGFGITRRDLRGQPHDPLLAFLGFACVFPWAGRLWCKPDSRAERTYEAGDIVEREDRAERWRVERVEFPGHTMWVGEQKRR